MPHILLLEDDAARRHGLGEQLQKEGFTWTAFDRVADALACLRQQSEGRAARADAALLGVNLADGEGLEVLRAIRAEPACRSMPVILMAGQADDLDRLLESEVGADDHLARSCSHREMVARVKALLRRASFMDGPNSDRSLRFGPIEADLEHLEARAGGTPLELTRREFELLAYFLKNPKRVLSRDKILKQVWGLEYLGESRTIDAHVRRLRLKLGGSAGHIETIVGVGYRLGGRESAEP